MGMTVGEWRNKFAVLGKTHRMAGFEIGWAILECVEQHGDKAYQWMMDLGLAENTLLSMARLAERWPREEVDTDLGFAYYRDAGLDKEFAEKLLAATKKNGWSREQMRKAKKELEAVEYE
jgi:hypothetical protein